MDQNTGQILNKWHDLVQSSSGEIQDKNVQCVKSDKEGVVRFFWLDAQQHFLKSVVFLFGKSFRQSSQSYVTSSIVVRNINRTVYLLPRSHFRDDPTKSVRLRDVYEEFKATIAVSLVLDKFESNRVVRSYIQEGEGPKEVEFLQVKYSFAYPEIAQTQGNTFSKIFGNSTHPLETFLLEQKIKGPCWLDVANVKLESLRITYCTHEYNCYKETDVSVVENSLDLPVPPLVIASVSFMAICADPKDVRSKDQIVMATCVVQEHYCVEQRRTTEKVFQKYFCIFTHPEGLEMPADIRGALETHKFVQVLKVDSEKALLYNFVEKFARINPDIVVGHDFYGNQFKLLHSRLSNFNFNMMGKCGRLVVKRSPKIYSKFAKLVMCGRWVCDLKISAEENTKCPSYDLHTLCKKILDIDSIDVHHDEIPKFYASSTLLLDLIAASLLNSVYTLKMIHVLNVIPVALGMTRLCGNLMSRTLVGGVSERIEFLLLHAFRERNYLTLEQWHKKRDLAKVTTEEVTTYSGGLVLAPKPGLYDSLVLYMDFKSLYPCIIQEWNVCFSTFFQDEHKNAVPLETSDYGILPSLLKSLTDRRSQVKSLMSSVNRESPIYDQYNTEQLVLKNLANSIYGYLSFNKSRFHAKHLAAFITEKGREILTSSQHLIEQMPYEIIYGDTDSLMIKTNTLDYDEAMRIGTDVCNEINRDYQSIKLEIESVFRYLLLLKKKRYAGVAVTKLSDGLHYSESYKGVDIVRRDCSNACSEISKTVLKHLFNDLPHKQRAENIYKYLHDAGYEIRNETDVNQFVIIQQLAKEPTQYSDPDNHAHVRIALRMSESSKQLRKGDLIPYVICNDRTSHSPNLRAYHVDELKKSSFLKVDCEYYIVCEVLPVISRLCEPVGFIDEKQIAVSLGANLQRLEQADKVSVMQTEVSAESSWEPFMYCCKSCNTKSELNEMTANTFLDHCPNENCSSSPQNRMHAVQNQLDLAVRALIKKFCSSELVCDNSICRQVTRYISLQCYGNTSTCSRCKYGEMQYMYTVKNLLDQLVYFKRVFSILSDSVQKRPVLSAQCMQLEAILEKKMQQYQDTVNLYELFAVLTPGNFDKREPDWTVLEDDFFSADNISNLCFNTYK